ncbi:MAG: hypothetical protein AB7O95_07620 [Geminicoccaceae bacterium]
MAASTYALDAVATTSGAALVLSGLLDRLDGGHLLAGLAASYLLWVCGLRMSIAANWALLEATGTSTSLPSLLAYELACARTRSRRMQRLAAGLGYVGTEIAKELPYYLAAFGAASLSADLTTGDALIFLIGANLGAAVYEGGLGIAVRVGLRHTAGDARKLRLGVA